MGEKKTEEMFHSMVDGRWSMVHVLLAGHFCLCLMPCITGVHAEKVESAPQNPWWMMLLHPLVFLPFHLGNVLCFSRVFPNWALYPLILLGLLQYVFEHQGDKILHSSLICNVVSAANPVLI